MSGDTANPSQQSQSTGNLTPTPAVGAFTHKVFAPFAFAEPKQGVNTMSQGEDGLPVFPMELVSSIRKTSFRYIYQSDMATAEDVEKLMDLTWRSPETRNFIFWECDNGLISTLQQALDSGKIAFPELQRHWHRHPNLKSDFIRIIGEQEFEWRDLTAKSLEFFRGELELTTAERRRRDNQALAKEIAKNAPEVPLPFGGRLGLHLNKYSTIYTIVGVIVTVISIALAFI
ncbi:hypothetical protein [Mesorhizobium sp. LNJC405B00]|uniref:hypothetical protein n=1 Tax=Mesorhizobium sp. LNJC405B00 TaxID=1287281 RepID=UPI0012EBF23B|nr:hypothetical protein [Mesorhizobium sp. LNJC405B00]